MRTTFSSMVLWGIVASMVAGCTPAAGVVPHTPSERISGADGEAESRAPVASDDADSTGRSDRRSARKDVARTWEVAVVSDLNGSYGSTDYDRETRAAVDWLTNEVEPDAVVSTGDMVAGQKAGLDYEAMWHAFHEEVTDPLAAAGIPLAVTPGNHDAAPGSDYVDERVTYVDQWTQQRPDLDYVDDTFYPLHYAFELGPVLFVSLDATTVGPLDDEQLAWLDEVLTEHADSPFKVVFGHVPLYPFTEEKVSEVLGDKDLEQLLGEHDVDMMLSGHHHAYYPGKRDDLRLVGMSCLGSGSRTLVGDDGVSEKSVALLRFDTDGTEISVDAFDPTDRDRIERDSLPPHLNSGTQRIWRDDVVQRASK
ncbi:MAG: metallophosphoesterase family protein [Persicimonas sp.]